MATHWDNIYKAYKRGGAAWATLGEEIHPDFTAFVRRTAFPVKHALDIGPGTGIYLKFLAEEGFAILDGVDSSPTAAKMTEESVPGAHVEIADMYEWPIPGDRYDFALSVSTIHHGTKERVAALIDAIYDALLPGGFVFITIPDWDHANTKQTPATHELLGEGVSAPLSGPEKGLIHSFYTEAEVRQLFSAFQELSLRLDAYHRWVVTGRKEE